VRKAIGLLLVGLAAAGGLSCGGGSAPAAIPAEKHPPVVMIVFDEFSTTSLVDRNHRIDPVRYPSFAGLAKDGTWFPNSTASLDETGRAVSSLFTGRNITKHAKPTFRVNRNNLFTLMARRYRLNVSEEVSNLCPRRLCPSSRPQTKRSVLHKLAGGRGQRFDRWVRSIRRGSKPTFYFKHALLPHAPWRYLPSGRQFRDGKTQRLYSWNLLHFTRWLVDQSYQRHLLQVGYTDRLLGRALARLRATGLYDRALIVVTADNGEGFGRLGNGHEISRRNAGDIALTPLLIKLPGQRSGRIVRRHVRTMDLVPTIARLAGVRIPWHVDGRSVFGPAARRIPSTTVLYKRSGQRVRLSLGSLTRRANSSLRLKLRLFGSGKEPPGLFGIGPRPSLHGTPVSRLTALPPGRTRAALDAASRYARVRRSSGSVPVRVMGKLTGRGSRRRADIAVAVNGTIAATAPTFAPKRGATQLFSVLVPESSLRDGRNGVKLYAIVGGTRLRPLTP
jgi:hypothetical protein